MSSLRVVACWVACGMAFLVLPGCASESRRTGSDDAGSATNSPSSTAEKGEPQTGTVSATAKKNSVKAPEAPKKTFPQEWTRLPVKSAKLERKEGKATLTVEAAAPSAGWKVEIRPITETSEAVVEFEVVGMPPKGPAATVIDDQTVTYSGEIKDVDQVLVHGKDGVIFPD